ncbi:hypothetical protein, partial [Salmonella enterica]|uniref:hypothetical protein n=1 Tax=Salmonella enterica TaxID=28901 RepID=UPI0032969401
SDNDLSTHGSNSDFDTIVSIFGQFPSQDFIEFSEEDSVSVERSLFADLSCGRHGFFSLRE